MSPMILQKLRLYLKNMIGFIEKLNQMNLKDFGLSMEVEKKWFDLLISGEKPIEGRKKSPQWEKLKVNQEIEVTCKETKEIRIFKITHINEYQNLEEYLQKEGLYRCLPGITSIEDGIVIYHQWSTQEELNKYKFLAIGMHVID